METINIRTSQNVVINYELAPLRDRFVGLFIDILLTTAAHYLVVLLVYYIMDISSYYYSDNRLLSTILSYFGIIAFFFYTLGMEVLNNGQSLGKMAVGTKVVKLDGSVPSLSDHLIRILFYLIDFTMSLGVFGAIFIATSEQRQRMGDRAANTVVVKMNVINMFNLTDILNISTVEDYEPIYPDIKNVQEKDMLIVKNALLRHRNNPSLNNVEMINKLANKMIKLLDVKVKPTNNLDFLKTLIKDYIVLTR